VYVSPEVDLEGVSPEIVVSPGPWWRERIASPRAKNMLGGEPLVRDVAADVPTPGCFATAFRLGEGRADFEPC